MARADNDAGTSRPGLEADDPAGFVEPVEAEDVAPIALGESVRALCDAVVLADVSDDERTALAAEVDTLTARLLAHPQRDAMPWPSPASMLRAHRPYSPLIGAANPIAPPMLVRKLDDDSVVGEATMRAIHEGPPTAVHGGWVASLLDQLLGHANAAAGVGGMTVELTINYRRPTPYNEPLVIRARMERHDGRKVWTSGEITADGVVTAEAKGFFLQPDAQRVEHMRQALEDRESTT